jgi:hypothetical protein
MLKKLTTYILLLITLTFILGDFYLMVPSLWYNQEQKNIFSFFLIVSLLALLFSYYIDNTKENEDWLEEQFKDKK